jgi:hypothetical protein
MSGSLTSRAAFEKRRSSFRPPVLDGDLVRGSSSCDVGHSPSEASTSERVHAVLRLSR